MEINQKSRKRKPKNQSKQMVKRMAHTTWAHTICCTGSLDWQNTANAADKQTDKTGSRDRSCHMKTISRVGNLYLSIHVHTDMLVGWGGGLQLCRPIVTGAGVSPSLLPVPVLRLRRSSGGFIKMGMEEICVPVNVFDTCRDAQDSIKMQIARLTE